MSTTNPDQTKSSDTNETVKVESDVKLSQQGNKFAGKGSFYKRNNNYGRRNQSSNNSTKNTQAKEFKGECEDIKAVLAMSYEENDLKKTFEEFKDALSSYCSKNLTNGADLAPFIYKSEDPKDVLDTRLKPEDISGVNEYTNNPIKRVNYEKRLGLYLARVEQMEGLYTTLFGDNVPQR